MKNDLVQLMDRSLTVVAGPGDCPKTRIRDYLQVGVNVAWRNNDAHCDVYYDHGDPQNDRALRWVEKFKELAEGQHNEFSASYEAGHLIFGLAEDLPKMI